MLAVVGGGGFIGTNIVTHFDSRIIEKGDPLDFTGCNTVIHLAANANLRNGWEDPTLDIRENYLLTSTILEAMRAQGIRRLVFASSGSVYRPRKGICVEDSALEATSLYAATKIAAEQLIAAYAHAGHIDATILRFVSVLGPHLHRGLIADFVKKLRNDQTGLDVLAPGTSQKSYIHVADILSALSTVLKTTHRYEVYNVGTNATMTPTSIAEIVMDEMGVDGPVRLVGNTWVGDNPHILLATEKLHRLGWTPAHTIEEAVRATVAWLR